MLAYRRFPQTLFEDSSSNSVAAVKALLAVKSLHIPVTETKN